MNKLFATFILSVIFLNLKCANSNASLFLIPQPQRIEIKNNTYSFNIPFTFNLVNTDTFYLRQLADAITKKFRTRPADSIPARNRIELINIGGADFNKIIKSKKLKTPFGLGTEGYILSVSPESISIIANENAGVFYGVQTLIQLIDANSKDNTIPCMTIYDKPDMQMRGWQDDISRGPIPTMNFLKEEIRRMSSFKLNTFTLYTEHVFKLTKHPEIAPPDGITAEEVEELSSFARKYNVDIIGNFQSFGHFGNILKVSGYEQLGENASTLSPAKEESYKFLADVYSEIAPAYESKYFHINCDEVSLGNGPSKKMIDSIGVDGVYAYHINRIDSLLKPYHKRIMMWGDIAVKNPKIIDKLPKDMIIVSWGYSAQETMDSDIVPFVKSGFEFIVAPGVSCWSAIYPDMSRAVINIYNYLRDGYKNKALGFINTTWDDGGQNLFNNNWYSLIWGADCGWNAPLNEPVERSNETRKRRVAAFNKSYNKVYFDTDSDITSLLFGISDLKYGPVQNCLTDASIWNPLLPDYEMIPENYRRDNLSLIKTIDSLSAQANKLKPYFGDKVSEFDLLPFALRQARFVANKNLLGIKLRNYVNEDSLRGNSYFEKDYTALDDTIKNLKAAYGRLWVEENRKWWLDTVYSYYDSFAKNLNDLTGVCIIRALDKLVNGKREIILQSAYKDLPVYYTTDGSIPTLNSKKYAEPIYTDTNINISARVIDNGRVYEVQSDSFIFHKGIGKLRKLNSKWSTINLTYAARGEYALLDGRRGSKNSVSDNRWQGYIGNDIDIELDFNGVSAISKITMGFTQYTRWGVLFPRQIEVMTSSDGINYTLRKKVENIIDPKIQEWLTHDFVIPLDGINSRYLKVIAKNPGLLPEWHPAKGKASTMFADEIIIE